MIPKRIFTIWLSEDPIMPDLIERCIKTHELEGYEHRLITLENCARPRYVEECISAKKWAKAADFLRIHYLFEEGGIYLDADCEVLKPFDPLLDQPLFCGKEENEFVSNAIIGAVKEHPLLAKYIALVKTNFIGSGDLVFPAGMYLWTELAKDREREVGDIKIYPPEYFLPYNHHIDRLKLTDNSFTIHHFERSWKK